VSSADEHAATLPASAASEAYCGTCNRSFGVDRSTCPYDGTSLVLFKERTDALLGRVLDGRYRIEARIGEGGMGAVYRGRQLSVDRMVAVKVMHPTFAADRDVAKRFLREARLASSLSAPGIVSVFEFGQTDDGLLYLVMELIDGTPLETLVKQGTFTPTRVVHVALQLCDALEVAHAAGIIHRDLKPGNIIMLDTPTGEVVKVLDFGIAKIADAPSITSTRGAVGTPAYMAPEQFDGRADLRSDLYSLGCVLYQLASGAPPFSAHEISALYIRHLTEPPPPLPHDVPPELVAAIERLLAKNPEDRFASVAELRTTLARVPTIRIGSAPIIRTSLTPIPTLPPDEAPPVTRPPARSRSVLPLVIAAVLIAASAGVVGYLAMHRTTPNAARPAPAAAPIAEPEPVAAPSPGAEPARVTAPEPAVVAAPAAEVVDAGVPVITAPVEAAPVTKPSRPTTPKRRPPPAKKKPRGETELPFAPT
jgi:serine/threonine-protein kinase